MLNVKEKKVLDQEAEQIKQRRATFDKKRTLKEIDISDDSIPELMLSSKNI
jgi:hypothetical protein